MNGVLLVIWRGGFAPRLGKWILTFRRDGESLRRGSFIRSAPRGAETGRTFRDGAPRFFSAPDFAATAGSFHLVARAKQETATGAKWLAR